MFIYFCQWNRPADAPELQRRSWLHEAEERCRALGADMWGALSEDGFLLALEADDLFALEMPLWQVMADFAADHGWTSNSFYMAHMDGNLAAVTLPDSFASAITLL